MADKNKRGEVMLLYIHGFRSTENSTKAVQLKRHFAGEILIARFSHEPEKAIEVLENLIEEHEITGMIASSLGGFYATYLAQKYQLKALLINPSTRPYETLRRYLGENETHDGEIFMWEESHLLALAQYAVEKPTAKHYAIFLKKGDTILDYTVAKRYYDGGEIMTEEGGDHRFADFEKHLDKVDTFFEPKICNRN
jgi:predicted esterase YcpF (UPF0227 family)